MSLLKEAADRFTNAIVALQAAPGGGKSFFLDQVAKLQEEDLVRFCKPMAGDRPELKDYDWGRIAAILRNMQPVCVTFNSATRLLEVEKAWSPGTRLALRMVFSYFLRETRWSDFVEECKRKLRSMPTCSGALRVILDHSGKGGVLLCIDELVKVSNDDAEVRTLLSEVGGLLSENSAEQFCAIISTLDARPVVRVTTESGRPVDWIPLRPLKLGESRALFANLLNKVEDERRKEFLRSCIAECGGHPRTLQYLYQRLALDPVALTKMGHDDLVVDIVDRLFPYFGTAEAFELVRIALRGDLIPLNQNITVGELTKPLSDYIRVGYFVNQLETTRDRVEVIPRILPMVLYCFARALTRPGVPADHDARNVATCLVKMFAASASSHTSSSYEAFHSWWEVLHRIVRFPSEGRVETLAGLYRIQGWDNSPAILVRRKTLGVLLTSNYFPPEDDQAIVTNTGASLTKDDLLRSVIVSLRHDNPGIDIALFEEKPSGDGCISLGSNMKHTLEGTKNNLKPGRDINPAVKNTAKAYSAHVKGGKYYDKSPIGKLKMDAQDVFIIIASWRNVAKNRSPVKGQLIILTREHLKRLYTPSLYPIPQNMDDTHTHN